ncbi:unnamed protein product, partial [Aureobasidium mustum]
MTTNPNLLFALENISKTPVQTSSIPTTVATPLGPHRTLARAKILAMAVSTASRSPLRWACAERIDSKVPCTGCKGTGFVGARCSACAIGAVLAQRVLVKEIAADVLVEDGKRAKSRQEQTSTTKMTLKPKEASAEKDSRARETMDENVSDEDGKTSKER